MDAEGLADMLLWACLLSIAQAAGSLLVDALRPERPQQHPLDDHARALLLILSEELPAVREALEKISRKRGG